jgi:hypothetical protein
MGQCVVIAGVGLVSDTYVVEIYQENPYAN